MADKFTPTKHESSTINGGVLFADGDTPQKEAFNNTIENSLYAVKLAEDVRDSAVSKKGTVVTINGVPEAEISFTSNPQTQIDKIRQGLNDKPNREQVNNLSMCPSGTSETFISENVFTLKQAPANGYVVLSYEGAVTDITLFSRLEKYGAVKLDNAVYKGADGIYYGNLPVAKGDWVVYTVSRTAEPTSFSINFVYAKEV